MKFSTPKWAPYFEKSLKLLYARAHTHQHGTISTHNLRHKSLIFPPTAQITQSNSTQHTPLHLRYTKWRVSLAIFRNFQDLSLHLSTQTTSLTNEEHQTEY